MLQRLRARAQNRRKADEIYGAVVTAARAPQFYSGTRVPDTPEGRFEMVCLMLFLVLERLKQSGNTDLTQAVIEAFVTDMDDCMREMGVGDLTVPKKVKRAAAAFYERSGAYRAAIEIGDNKRLSDTIRQFVFQGSADAPAGALAANIETIWARLDQVRNEITDASILASALEPAMTRGSP